MINLNRGIQTVEIPLTARMFESLYRLTESGTEMAMKRKLSYQYRGAPRFDPRDVLSIDWQEAPRRLAEFDYPVLAVLKVARGARLLSEFLLDHLECQVPSNDLNISVWRRVDNEEVRLECECGDHLLLETASLTRIHVTPPDPPPRARDYSDYTEEDFV